MKVHAEKQRVRFSVSEKLEIVELITDKKMTIRQGNLIYIFCIIYFMSVYY